MHKANALQENDITEENQASSAASAAAAATNTSKKASYKSRCISLCNEGVAMAASAAAVPPMPWFGMDIGGTLAKLVYFEPTDDLAKVKEGEENAILSNIKLYLTKNKAYGDSGHRDAHIQMDDVSGLSCGSSYSSKLHVDTVVVIVAFKVTIDGRRGSLHFIRFPTSAMNAFVELAKRKGMAELASTVCATGGGAYKFQELIEREVKLKMHKFDELNSLIRGVNFMERSNPGRELFYYVDARYGDESGAVKTPYVSREIYPFMLVNIGSGVSILNVEGPEMYKRVHGTSLGGGTFLGLTCLLTDCQSFEEAMELAAKGDNRNVDKLVKDIYGGSYEYVVSVSINSTCARISYRNSNNLEFMQLSSSHWVLPRNPQAKNRFLWSTVLMGHFSMQAFRPRRRRRGQQLRPNELLRAKAEGAAGRLGPRYPRHHYQQYRLAGATLRARRGNRASGLRRQLPAHQLHLDEDVGLRHGLLVGRSHEGALLRARGLLWRDRVPTGAYGHVRTRGPSTSNAALMTHHCAKAKKLNRIYLLLYHDGKEVRTASDHRHNKKYEINIGFVTSFNTYTKELNRLRIYFLSPSSSSSTYSGIILKRPRKSAGRTQ